MTDIRICEEQPKHSGGDIRVCDEKSAESGGDVRVCSDDKPDPCRDAAVPVVSGDADCNVGDIYTASGGVPPYTWGFSGGSIDQDGEIQSISSCGAQGTDRTAQVSVFDSCGRRGSLTVRLAGGVFRIVDECYASGNSRGYEYCPVFYSFTEIDGGNRYRYEVRQASDPLDCQDATPNAETNWNPPDYWDCCKCSPPSTVLVEDMDSWAGLLPGLPSPIVGQPYHVVNKVTFEWQC